MPRQYTNARPGGRRVVGSEKPPERVKTEVVDSQVSVAPTRAFPVSIKGVVVQAGRVLLLHNQRHERELPGGKLEVGEDPAACVARGIAEETGRPVTTGPILDAWQYHIRPGIDVLIVTY
jgi:8-oxo-dGTP pyrophosphatase MutT (NUDIX family)